MQGCCVLLSRAPHALQAATSRLRTRTRTRAATAAGGAKMLTEFQFTNGRNQALVGYEFLPEGKPWATLVFHHGVCEHAGRYIPVFQHLADAGVAVYTFDVHGHGKSEPKAADERCLIYNYNDLVDDLYTFVGTVEQRVGGRLPASSSFLAGQSMGGLVVALAAVRCQERWAGLVVFSGAMGVVWTTTLRIQAAVGNLLSSVLPKKQLVPAVKPENLHPDPAVVERFKSDPLIFHGDLRVKTANELLKAMSHLACHRKELQLPIYAVHGTNDHVTSFEAIVAFTGGVSGSDVTLNKVEGGYHEMLMGDERLASADALVAWLKQRAGKAPPAAAAAAADDSQTTAGPGPVAEADASSAASKL